MHILFIVVELYSPLFRAVFVPKSLHTKLRHDKTNYENLAYVFLGWGEALKMYFARRLMYFWGGVTA